MFTNLCEASGVHVIHDRTEEMIQLLFARIITLSSAPVSLSLPGLTPAGHPLRGRLGLDRTSMTMGGP